MAYKSESYKQFTGSVCERCYALYGLRKEDDKERMVILTSDSGSSANNIYICLSCIMDIAMYQQVKMNYSTKNFHLSRDGMISYMDHASIKPKLGPENLRSTLSRYEGDWRDMRKKIRALEGKYTNRNTVVDDVNNVIKNILSAVEQYLQKT